METPVVDAVAHLQDAKATLEHAASILPGNGITAIAQFRQRVQGITALVDAALTPEILKLAELEQQVFDENEASCERNKRSWE
jgi:hypothetical protein